MHFTGTVYRNPYWPTWPLLEITQGCTHNSCKFCTMYKEVPFRMSPMEWIEEDLQELARTDPNARTIQILSANPLVLTYDKLAPIFEMIHKYLPKMEYIYLAGRVTDLRNKTVDCNFITHHTVAANLTGPNFLARKDRIIAALDHAIRHGDMDRMAALRRNKRTL